MVGAASSSPNVLGYAAELGVSRMRSSPEKGVAPCQNQNMLLVLQGLGKRSAKVASDVT